MRAGSPRVASLDRSFCVMVPVECTCLFVIVIESLEMLIRFRSVAPFKITPNSPAEPLTEFLPSLLLSSWHSASVLSWNYLSKIQNTPLQYSPEYPSWLLRSLQTGSMFSWPVLVRENGLFTTSISPDCLGLMCCGVGFRFSSSAFKVFGTWKISEYSSLCFPPFRKHFRCPCFRGTCHEDTSPPCLFWTCMWSVLLFLWSNK